MRCQEIKAEQPLLRLQTETPCVAPDDRPLQMNQVYIVTACCCGEWTAPTRAT